MARNFFEFWAKNKPIWVSGKTKNIPGTNWLNIIKYKENCVYYMFCWILLFTCFLYCQGMSVTSFAFCLQCMYTLFAYLPISEIRKKGHWCLTQTAVFKIYLFYFLNLFIIYYFSPENLEIGTSRFLGVFKLGNQDTGRYVFIYIM